MSETNPSRGGRPIIAIGDVHGCAYELSLLLQRLTLTPESEVIFIGDLIDRGPASRAVVEVVMELSSFCRVSCLLGNHEDMLLGFLGHLKSPTSRMFIFNGGGATLASYSNDAGDYEVPAEHLSFLTQMKLYHETEDYFFVHAGVPDLPIASINPEVNRQQLLWSRTILQSGYEWSKVVVHGHTQQQRIELKGNRINIDTGCVYGNRLSAIELPSRKVVSVRASRGNNARLLADRASRRKAVRFSGSVPVHVRYQGRILGFETANFSQVGMLIRSLSPESQPRIRLGEMITGTIGEGATTVAFAGVVTRSVARSDGQFYGAKFTFHGPVAGAGHEFVQLCQTAPEV